jgi:hypothetical protein
MHRKNPGLESAKFKLRRENEVAKRLGRIEEAVAEINLLNLAIVAGLARS